ncbi:hypothetical protein L1049_015553 [Liquidambar formosana]|uniref:Uncharacterized protein n=1 Tax=Liquidambar formosana TaxID=63359 RepID=A0AAP0RY92_LIQFO
MPMPPFSESFNFDNISYFGESRGHLHLIVIEEPMLTECDIWELKTDYSGWFVRYRVNLDPLAIPFPETIWNLDAQYEVCSLLGIVRAEKEEESILVLFVSGKAISFNLNDKTSKKLCDLMPCPSAAGLALDYEWLGVYQYVDTIFHVWPLTFS